MTALQSTAVHSSTDLRTALTELRRISEMKWQGNEHYGLDRLSADRYLDLVPKWENLIRAHLRAIRLGGRSPVYVDICGRTTAECFGVTHNYSFSLQPVRSWQRAGANEEEPRFRGDIFSQPDFARFLQQLRRSEARPDLVIFEPVAGLQEYIASKVSSLFTPATLQILEHQLSRLVRVMQPGGYLLLSNPFQFGTDTADFLMGLSQKEYRSSAHVKKLARKLKCTYKISTSIFGPRWLLRTRAK